MQTPGILAGMVSLLALGAMFPLPCHGSGIDVVQNGGFENGSAGWQVNGGWLGNGFAEGCLTWFAVQASGATGCGPPLAAAASGSAAAYMSGSFSAAPVGDPDYVDSQLFQFVTLPANITSAQFSFSLQAAWDGSGPYRELSTYVILNPIGAGFDSINDLNIYPMYDFATDGTLPWTTYSIDVTQYLQWAGQPELQIDFVSRVSHDAGAPTLSAATAIDDVSLVVTTTPEPGTAELMALAAALLIAGRIRFSRPSLPYGLCTCPQTRRRVSEPCALASGS